MIFSIKPVYVIVKNPQVNNPVERFQKLIYNMIVIEDIYNKVVDYIYK